MNLPGDLLLTNIKCWKWSTAHVVGEAKSFSWGGAQTKGEVHKCKLTKNMFLHSDLLKFFLKKKQNITDLFPDTTVVYD